MSKPVRRGLERRAEDREENPPCPMCSAPPNLATVTARTAFVFFKCRRCGHVWETAIPQEHPSKRSRS